MIPVFVLSYSRLHTFKIPVHEDIAVHIIDNYGQKREDATGCYYYATSRNIGCAGGWNLICDIAFNALDLQKIIITQDDVDLPVDLLIQAYHELEQDEIIGLIQPFYEFSAFVISKQVWQKVGRFDENCLFVYGEDVDYKQRCLLNDVQITSFYEPNLSHGATIADHPSLNRIRLNRDYIRTKWGDSIHPDKIAKEDGQPPFLFNSPFDHNGPTDYIHIGRDIVNLYGTSEKFPSEEEYLRFLEYGFN